MFLSNRHSLCGVFLFCGFLICVLLFCVVWLFFDDCCFCSFCWLRFVFCSFIFVFVRSGWFCVCLYSSLHICFPLFSIVFHCFTLFSIVFHVFHCLPLFWDHKWWPCTAVLRLETKVAEKDRKAKNISLVLLTRLTERVWLTGSHPSAMVLGVSSPATPR